VATLAKLDPEEKNEAFASCDQKLVRIKEQRKGYNLEMRQLEKEDQRKYQTVRLPFRAAVYSANTVCVQKLKEYMAKVTSLETDLKWARTEANRKQLMSGATAST
jgi:hypothetical protein